MNNLNLWFYFLYNYCLAFHNAEFHLSDSGSDESNNFQKNNYRL